MRPRIHRASPIPRLQFISRKQALAQYPLSRARLDDLIEAGEVRAITSGTGGQQKIHLADLRRVCRLDDPDDLTAA